MDFAAIKAYIQSYIKQNGNEEITGDILQDVLLSIVTTMGEGTGGINDLTQDIADEVQARELADTLIRKGIMAYCGALSVASLNGNQEIYQWTCDFPAGARVFLRIRGGSVSGNAALSIIDDTNAVVAVINNANFNDYIVETRLPRATASLTLRVSSGGMSTNITGAVYAYVTDKVEASPFVEDGIETYADCLRELYLRNLGSGDYYLFIRRITGNNRMYVQICTSATFSDANFVAEAVFNIGDGESCIAAVTEKHSSGISGFASLDTAMVRGMGTNNFVTAGHKIVKKSVTDIWMSPVIKAYMSYNPIYFEGLNMSQNYYLRMIYISGSNRYYIQLATSASVTSDNLVAQGLVVAPGMQILDPYNDSGIHGYVQIESMDTFPAYLIDNDTATDLMSNTEMRVFLLESTVGKDITVSKSGGGDYTSLLEGILEATRTVNTTVYVNGGTYDLVSEFTAYYGSSFFTSYNESSVRGIILKNRVKVIFASTAKVTFNYTGSNEYVKSLFSPFNSGNGGFLLENLNLEASNCRYCIHDERAGSSDQYTNIYRNCSMKLDNSNNKYDSHGSQTRWGYIQCIGGGLGKSGEIEVERCTFESLGQQSGGEAIVSWHNAEMSGAQSRLFVFNNYFKGTGGFRLSWYGTSTLITTAILGGNRFGRAIIHNAEGGATVHNTEIIEWNNIVGS